MRNNLDIKVVISECELFCRMCFQKYGSRFWSMMYKEEK